MRRFITLTLFGLAGSPQLFAADYAFVRIDPPASVETQATSINARGDIVGRYVGPDHVSHGFLLRKGVFTTIDVPDAFATLGARGINARGDIVGNFLGSDFLAHGFLLSDGRFTRLDYPGALDGLVETINDAGDITGVWFNALGIGSGFIRKDGKFHDVRIPGASGENVRSAQNNGRVLVGSLAMNFDGGGRGFIRRNPGEVELIEYPGLSVPCSGLRSINQRGEIVGSFAIINPGDECHPPFTEQHGFLLLDGEFTLIDFPGSDVTDVFDINDDGVMVGRYLDGNGMQHGFKAKPKTDTGNR
jgi:hypothetical protein